MSTDISPFLVPEDCTVRQAMEQLERTEAKILFVVDGSGALVGSVTDGDIRRWILCDGNLTAPVPRVCNRNPCIVSDDYSSEEIRREMLQRNLSCVPVVNGGRRIVGLLFWKEIFQGGTGVKPKRRLNSPVVIMAGGKGTRLEPFTKILPKPLIPIGDRTVIEIIIDKFLPYGVRHFYLSVNYKSKIIKSFFEDLAPDYSIEYLEETVPLGTAGCLRSLYAPVPESIIVTNCDILIDADYSELTEFHEANKYDITLVASLKDYNIPYGVCEIENGGSLARITEKPQYSFLVNTGMYVVRRNKLNLIPEGRPFDMPHLMHEVKEYGGRVGVFPISHGAWIDTGEWSEYRKALEHMTQVGFPLGVG